MIWQIIEAYLLVGVGLFFAFLMVTGNATPYYKKARCRVREKSAHR
jgi:hypothetical protein